MQIFLFRENFCDKEHLNYRGNDPVLGPILISVSTTELIVRTSNGTVTDGLREESSGPASLSPDTVLNLTKFLAPEVTAQTISLIDNDKAQVL